jgi:hypothetical protein
MKNLYIYFFALFLGCSGASNPLPQSLTYTVSNEKNPVNNVVIVNINQRLSVEQLAYLADEIFKSLPKKPNTFIGYLLPNMKKGAGAWAVTNYTPELEIEILGTSKEEFDERQKRTLEISKKAIGVWEGIEPDKFNYALVDSSEFYLLKLIFPKYEITDTVNVKQMDGESFIYLKNAVGKQHYKINLLDQLIYFDESGKTYQSYQSLKK